MNQELRIKNKIRFGFTLVEVLVAVTIMAILSTIGYVSYSAAGRSGRDAKRKADLENIRSALEIYKAENNCYPPNDNTDPNGINKTKFNSTYINPFPQDPKSPYKYWFQPQSGDNSCKDGSWGAKTYALCAYLENGTSLACGGIDCGTGVNSCKYRVNSP